MRVLLPALLVALSGCFGGAPRPDAGESRVSRMAMGTLVEISARGTDAPRRRAAIEGAFAEIERLEALLSEWRDSSQISQLNREAGKAMLEVSPETEAVLRLARDVAEQSDGAFDPTVLPLVDAWGFFKTQGAQPPTQAEREAARALVDWRALEIAPGHARLARARMQLGLGAIAKGYIADRALEVLRAAGLEAALVIAGGDLAAFAPRGHGFAVQIGSPGRPGHVFAELVLEQGGLATSAATYRYREVGGRRVGHIIDPRSGEPADSNRSSTVLAPNAAMADAWATALQVLGAQARDYVEARAQLEALVIDRDGGRWTSPSLAQRIRWLPD